METDARQVLVAGEASGFAERAPELFPQSEFDFHYAADARGANELVHAQKVFDVILVEFDGDQALIRELVKGVRWSGSQSKQATIILLSSPELLDAAEELLDTGITRILNPAASDDVLSAALAEVLHHEVRYPVRALLRIDGEDLGHKGVLMTQTENLSVTGMLVRFDKQVYLGSRFGFSLEAPGLTKAIRGQATVVRLSKGGVRATGFAAQFGKFDGDGFGRLKGFLAAQPPPERAKPGE